jgi:hypothetical protein
MDIRPPTVGSSSIVLSCELTFALGRGAPGSGGAGPLEWRSASVGARATGSARPRFRYDNSRSRCVRISKLSSIPLKISESGLNVTLVPLRSETPTAAGTPRRFGLSSVPRRPADRCPSGRPLRGRPIVPKLRPSHGEANQAMTIDHRIAVSKSVSRVGSGHHLNTRNNND